jgi:hypothetical protein
MVTTKFSPVRIEENPVMNHGSVGEAAAVGRVERPAGIHPARDHGIKRENGADDVNVPTKKIEPRKCQVAGPDHHGHQKIAQRRWDGGNQEKENHDDAVHGEQLVVGLRLYQRALRLDQMQAHQDGEEAAHKKHQSNGRKIKKCDALVVGG